MENNKERTTFLMDRSILSEEAKKSQLKAQMARRKGEVSLQQDLETQEDWEQMLAKEGLTVVDIYQEWAGPCISMVSNFKRIKNQVTDDLLHFVTAKADRIEALEKYRGKCEPCFLLIAGGSLVNVIRGAKSPLLMKVILHELEQEHKVLKGECKRKVIVDEVIEHQAEKEIELEEENLLHFNGELINFADKLELSSGEELKEVTVAIIKPDVVQEGKVDEIIQQMEEDGIEIIAQEERQLTEEEAREFYSHLAEESFFEDYIQFMTSGSSYILVLSKGETGKGIIEEWKNKLGPPDVETAKDSAPDSWRAKFGSKGYMNALHGSDGPDSAIRELAFFFPNLDVPTYQKHIGRLERTFALIRPEAYQLYKDEIIEKIKEAGFKIALQKVIQLTKAEAEEFYNEHKEQEYFEELTEQMSSGPLLALGLAREDAINKWRDLLGPPNIEEAKEKDPNCLRAQYNVPGLQVNMLHGAKTSEEAEAEINQFFPVEKTVAAIKPDAFGTKEEIINKIHEAGFQIAAQKETLLTPAIIESFYGNHKEKEYFDDLVNYMVSGPTMLMVLTREGAIDGWRSLMGPTDPEIAKEENPEFLRAKYGTDIMHNAVHGCSTGEKVEEIINTIFTDEENGDKAEDAKQTSETQEAADVDLATTGEAVESAESVKPGEGEGEGEPVSTSTEDNAGIQEVTADSETNVSAESVDNTDAAVPIVEFPESPQPPSTEISTTETTVNEEKPAEDSL